MKKITLIIAVVFTLLIQMANSQNLIAVQNGGTTTFYTDINAAITGALAGDTIYLPGGSFTILNSISKPIHIVGVGHDPDSTNATNYTYLNGSSYPAGSLQLTSGASGGSISGVLIPSTFLLGDGNGCATNYKIYRCKIKQMASMQSNTWQCSPSNISIIECIIDYIGFPSASNLLIYNNILISLSGIGSNNVVRNNVFLSASTPLSTSYYFIVSSYFENNIFIGSPFIYYYSNTFNNNVFNNNIFVENVTFPYQGTSNIGINNIINQSPNSIFVNQTGNSFSYDLDYHLQPNSPGKNAGTDGTDIGIYGGAFPWKEGSLPPNPHLQSKVVSNTTDQSGNLNVNIKVAAQDR